MRYNYHKVISSLCHTHAIWQQYRLDKRSQYACISLTNPLLLSAFTSHLSGVGLHSPLPTFSCWGELCIIPTEGDIHSGKREMKSSHILVCNCNSICDLRQGKTTLPPRCRKCNIQKSRVGVRGRRSHTSREVQCSYLQRLSLPRLCNQSI